MKITLEQIDLLKKRAKVSYAAAKEALEKSNNDMVEALVYLEEQNKKTTNREYKGKVIGTVKNIIKKGNHTRLIIEKDEHTLVNLSLTVTAIIGIVATPLLIVGLPAALLTNHKIKFGREDGKDIEVNEIIDNFSPSINSSKEKPDIDLNK